MDVVETAKYKITGLVDIYDEQMNIIGQFPIGSIQELPVEVGTNAVAEGRAEAVSDAEAAAAAPTPAEEPTGETGENEDDEDKEEEVL